MKAFLSREFWNSAYMHYDSISGELEIDAPRGTTIYAPEDGYVQLTYGSFGELVSVDGQRWWVFRAVDLYDNLYAIAEQNGKAHVRQGMSIGEVFPSNSPQWSDRFFLKLLIQGAAVETWKRVNAFEYINERNTWQRRR